MFWFLHYKWFGKQIWLLLDSLDFDFINCFYKLFMQLFNDFNVICLKQALQCYEIIMDIDDT